GCGGTAYTTDLKSVGESLRVQIPPTAPCRCEQAIRSQRFFSKGYAFCMGNHSSFCKKSICRDMPLLALTLRLPMRYRF
ncbi:MAG: hypothetical protein PUE41_01130, partial [bacterium]|nr:hypothetical protein [bacterium]